MVSNTKLIVQAIFENKDRNGNKIIASVPLGKPVELNFRQIYMATNIGYKSFQMSKYLVNKITKKWNGYAIVTVGAKGRSTWKAAEINIRNTFDYGNKREDRIYSQLRQRKKADDIAILSAPNAQIKQLLAQRMSDNRRIVQTVPQLV